MAISLLSSVGELGCAAAALWGQTPNSKGRRCFCSPLQTGDACCSLGRSTWHMGTPRKEALEPPVEVHVDPCHAGYGALQSEAIIGRMLLAPGQPGPFLMPRK